MRMETGVQQLSQRNIAMSRDIADRDTGWTANIETLSARLDDSMMNLSYLATHTNAE